MQPGLRVAIVGTNTRQTHDAAIQRDKRNICIDT